MNPILEGIIALALVSAAIASSYLLPWIVFGLIDRARGRKWIEPGVYVYDGESRESIDRKLRRRR